MARHIANPRVRSVGLAITTAVALSLATIVAPAGASTTVSTSAQFAAAWANPGTASIVLGADIAACGLMTRQATTPVAIHGHGHVLRQRCTGTILRQSGTGSVTIYYATLRDAHYNSSFQHGSALEAPTASVTLDHVVVTNNEALHGAVQAKSLVALDSTFASNGAQAFNISGGGGAAIVATNATIQRSTFTGNQVYGDGAALRAGGHVSATDSTFSGNLGKGGGQAITAGSADIARSTFNGNGSYAAPMGGAVMVSTTLGVVDSAFSGNRGGIGDGGAIGGQTVNVGHSLFDGNATDTGRGGAIFGVDITVNTSTFHGNATASDGGAIHAEHSLQVFRSTFDTNSSGSNPMATYDSQGGAISGQTGASLTIVNSTFVGNSAGSGFDGAAIAADGPVSLQFDTLDSNPTGDSAVSQVFGTTASTMQARGTVIVGGGPGRNCSITTTSRGSNYDDDGTCGFTGTGDTSNGADPQLGPLATNGGPTETELPASSSPLIDAVVGSCPQRDQRGTTRPRGAACDIGSVER